MVGWCRQYTMGPPLDGSHHLVDPSIPWVGTTIPTTHQWFHTTITHQWCHIAISPLPLYGPLDWEIPTTLPNPWRGNSLPLYRAFDWEIPLITNIRQFSLGNCAHTTALLTGKLPYYWVVPIDWYHGIVVNTIHIVIL